MAIPSKAELLKLDIQDRLELIEELWESVRRDSQQIPLTDDERAILDERLREDLENPDGARPWSEVREELRAGISNRR